MSTILEILFDHANRRLRRFGLFGALIGLPLIVYVEIPVETAAIQTELHKIGQSVTHNLVKNQQRIRAHKHRGLHAVKRRQRDRARHSNVPRRQIKQYILRHFSERTRRALQRPYGRA